MITQPRNVLLSDVELNWARLDNAIENPFGGTQWELQIATTDADKAKEMMDAGLNVKEKDGKSTVSLKRKATKRDGSAMEPVRVVDANRNPIENRRSIGNGSVGNVIVWQAPYESFGRTGVTSSLTAVQVTKLEVYEGSSASVDFDVVGADSAESLF